MVKRTNCDFVIKYDPKVDTAETVSKKIFYSVIVGRLKNKKPCVMFIGGDSGEGKSFASLRFQEMLMEIQGLALKDYMEEVNVVSPIQYPEKLDAILHDKRLKKVNMITMHEARTIVRAKNWQSFLIQAISDVNAMSRSIKRILFIIVSQFIRDIASDIRYTLNFYCIIRRPKGKKSRLYFNVLWKDDRDLEKPKLRKRKLSGYLVHPDGRYQRFVPEYFELDKPSPEIVAKFEVMDTEGKKLLIRHKMTKLINEMKAEQGEESNKIDSMVEYYTKSNDSITSIAKQYRGNWKVKKEVTDMHDLSKLEASMFQEKLNTKLKEKGMFEDVEL